MRSRHKSGGSRMCESPEFAHISSVMAIPPSGPVWPFASAADVTRERLVNRVLKFTGQLGKAAH